jgi:hypothetical protein
VGFIHNGDTAADTSFGGSLCEVMPHTISGLLELLAALVEPVLLNRGARSADPGFLNQYNMIFGPISHNLILD